MSGDSPNAFTNEHVFDFKDGGRISPAPTTSKERGKEAGGASGGVVTASVLVEQHKEAVKEDEPDFSTPILNPDHKEQRIGASDETDRVPELTNSGLGDRGGNADKEREDDNVANGGPESKLPRTPPSKDDEDSYSSSDEDSCIVNCIYYTMECCKCSIM